MRAHPSPHPFDPSRQPDEAEELPAGFRPPVNPSSNIKAVAWYGPAGEDLLQNDLTGHPEPHPSAQTGKLAVLFMNGTRYDYQGVDRETVAALLEAESIGKAFNANIKGNEAFHCAKVDPETGEPLTQETQS